MDSPTLFQREVVANLDVSYTAAATCLQADDAVNGALFDKLLVVTGEAPLLHTNFSGEALCKTQRYGNVSEWSWWLRCNHHTRGMARLVRFCRRDRKTRAPRLEKRRTTEQYARWTCSRRTTCFGAGLGHDVFIPLFQGKHMNLLELEHCCCYYMRAKALKTTSRKTLSRKKSTFVTT